jgi:hypothetical protein
LDTAKSIAQQRAHALATSSKSRYKSLIVLILFLSILALLFCFVWASSLAQGLDVPIWLACVLLVLVAFFGVPALIVGLVIIRRKLYQIEALDLSNARRIAKEPGTLVRLGAVTIWYSGTSKGMEILEDQLQEARARFADYIGEPVEVTKPLRVVSFADQEDFNRYLLRLGYQYGSIEGAYLLGGPARIAVCVAKPAHRLIKIDRLLRALFSYYFLEQHLGFFPQPWLYMGIGNLLADGLGEENQARLRRKMLVASNKGISLSTAEFFDSKPRGLGRAFGNKEDHDNFQYVSQFFYQAPSVLAYLSERNRRQTFLGFLKDLKKKRPIEPIFVHHFGVGFEHLLEDWKAWIGSLGPGLHYPPPKGHREQLLNYVIPLIRDDGAPIKERIQAIRDMGNAGYLLGADALIELLHDSEPRIRTVSLWALQNISGLALVDDVSQWSNWWDNLPADAQPVTNSVQTAPTQEA